MLIGFGGAAGGGKTRALAELAIDLALEFPGNRIVVGRKDFTDLRETTLTQFKMHVPPGIIARKNESEHWYQIRLPDWPPGVTSRVMFRELKDFLGLGSEEYGAVLVDEAGEVPEESALMLLSRLRWKLPPEVGRKIKYVFVAASNPWPGWFKKWFVDRLLPEEVLANYKATVHFVPAYIKDNPHLDPNYETFLRSVYPPEWVERFIRGSWDVYEDQVYPAFSPEVHRWAHAEIPVFDRLIGGLDFGDASTSGHYSAGIVAGVFGNRLLRVAEFLERGPDVVERQLRWMVEQEEKWGRHTHSFKRSGERQRILWIADRSQGAFIHSLRKFGFLVRPSRGGADSVRQGIALVARRLQKDSSGAPGSYYLPELRQFEKYMTTYRWPKQAEGEPPPRKPVAVDDDLMDADRYMHEALEVHLAVDPQRAYVGRLPRYRPAEHGDVYRSDILRTLRNGA